jgi:glycosyltransferase involved in cell wall biosynthesis
MKYSVFLPTRGRKELIGKAVESVLNQTLKDWQLVVLDNSDEPYWDVLPWDDDRIVYKHRICSGIADANAKAVALCEGDILLPLGDDDWLPEDCLKVSAKVMGDSLWLNGRTALHHPNGDVFLEVGGDQQSIDKTLAGKFWLGGANHWRRQLTKSGSFDSTYGSAADYDLYLRFLQIGQPALTKQVLYHYQDWEGTNTRQFLDANLEATARITSRLS